MRQWFKENKEINIIKYYQCRDTNTRDKRWLAKKDFKKCEICDEELFHLNHNSVRYIDGDGEDVTNVTQKRHMIFLDSEAHEHYTCYGINWCFKKVGYIPDDESEREIRIPTFDEFLNIDYSTIKDGDAEQVITVLKDVVYPQTVKPFFEKWIFGDITKRNVLEFLSDFTEVRKKFISRFDDRASVLLEKKIYRLLGVANES